MGLKYYSTGAFPAVPQPARLPPKPPLVTTKIYALSKELSLCSSICATLNNQVRKLDFRQFDTREYVWVQGRFEEGFRVHEKDAQKLGLVCFPGRIAKLDVRTSKVG